MEQCRDHQCLALRGCHAGLNWLDEYSGQTVDELLALEGEYRLDSLVLAFEQALDQKTERAGA
jgi:hypothetical protein